MFGRRGDKGGSNPWVLCWFALVAAMAICAWEVTLPPLSGTSLLRAMVAMLDKEVFIVHVDLIGVLGDTAAVLCQHRSFLGCDGGILSARWERTTKPRS